MRSHGDGSGGDGHHPVAQTARGWEPRIVAFLCNWCSYVGADLAGTSRIPYPDSVRIIRLPCTGRLDPLFVMTSLKRGADGVLVSGCHPGDCHYARGNLYARRRMLMLRRLLAFTGFEEERIQMSWVSASEGAKWAAVVTEMTAQVRELGPSSWGPGADGAIPVRTIAPAPAEPEDHPHPAPGVPRLVPVDFF